MSDYQLLDMIPQWPLVTAALLRRHATVCLDSALALHDLTDDIPRALHAAVPTGVRAPWSGVHEEVQWHRYDQATFDVGRTNWAIPNTDLTIGVYSPERAIADAYRLRGRGADYEAGTKALAEYMRRGGAPSRVADIAHQLPMSTRALNNDSSTICIAWGRG